MKRRDFIAASLAAFSALADSAWAKNKKSSASSSKSEAKSSHKTASTKSGKSGKSARSSHHGAEAAPVSSGPRPYHSPHSRPQFASVQPPPPAFVWREYDFQNQIEIPAVGDVLRVWVPMPRDSEWQRINDVTWQGNFIRSGIRRDAGSDLSFFVAEWGPEEQHPQAEMHYRIATRQRLFDITRRGPGLAEPEDDLHLYLQAASSQDGERSRELSERIVGRIREPMPQARALFDWVIDQSIDNRGSCGEMAALLPPGVACGDPLGTDIALSFVRLCRGLGIPARVVFGQRIGESRQFASLGANGDVSRAQHCRAEFYAPAYGWVPVDPADVVRAIREESLRQDDSRLQATRKRLFGFWEMNWVAYHYGTEVRLPGGPEKALIQVTSPQAAAGDNGAMRLITDRLQVQLTSKAL